MKNIQENILNFLEDETNLEENFQNLENIFNEAKIKDCKLDFLSLLHLISKISNNCHRFHHFFSQIERILQYFKSDIKKYFSNSQIFNIFKNNKRILLFLTEEGIIIFDEYIVKRITKARKYKNVSYPQYFHPEIQPFINENWFPKYDPKNCFLKDNKWVENVKKELPENFYEKRKKGENDSELCELIRNDLIKEFVVYINLHNISFNATIQSSIYETNHFLIKKQLEKENYDQNEAKKGELTLIEYAVFFGSIQIYNYLRIEKVELTSSLWLLAIHGQNADIIHSLEENHVQLEDETYRQCFYESLKCHHTDIANYFLNNFLEEKEENSQGTFNKSLKYYNFAFLKNEFVDEFSFYKLCKYGYCTLVDSLLENKEIDINKTEILRSFFF